MGRDRDIADKAWTLPAPSGSGSVVAVNSGEDGLELVVPDTGNLGGCRMYESSGTVLADTVLYFQQTAYDTHNIYTSANARFTVPTGITKVRCTAQLALGAIGTPISTLGTNLWGLEILWSGGSTQGLPFATVDSGGRFDVLRVTTGVLNVSAGQYFRAYFDNLSGMGTRTKVLDDTWFEMELIE